MAPEKIEDFSIERLNKRKKVLSVLLVILIAAVVLDSAAIIYDFVKGNGFDLSLFVPAIVCLGFSVLFYTGLKKINAELARRNDK